MILKVCACLSVHLPDFECMYCKGSIAHRPVCVQTGCMSEYGIACAKQKRGGGGVQNSMFVCTPVSSSMCLPRTYPGYFSSPWP